MIEGDETQYFDYKRILLGLSPTKDAEKVGISKRYIIKLQKRCRSQKYVKLSPLIKGKIIKFWQSNFEN